MLTSFLLPILSVAMAGLSVGLLLPQVWRCWRLGQTGGLSLSSVWLGPLTCFGWLEYSLLIHSSVQIWINLACLCLHLSILVSVLWQQPHTRQQNQFFGYIALAIAVVILLEVVDSAANHHTISAASAISWLGLVMAICSTVANLPQPLVLAKIYHRQTEALADISGVSLGRYRLALLSSVCWGTYGVLMGQGALILSSSLSMLTSVAVMGYLTRLQRRQVLATQPASAQPASELDKLSTRKLVLHWPARHHHLQAA